MLLLLQLLRVGCDDQLHKLVACPTAMFHSAEACQQLQSKAALVKDITNAAALLAASAAGLAARQAHRTLLLLLLVCSLQDWLQSHVLLLLLLLCHHRQPIY
jgi:hypothetical protein